MEPIDVSAVVAAMTGLGANREQATEVVERAAVAAITDGSMVNALAQIGYRSGDEIRHVIAYAERSTQHPCGFYACTPPVVIDIDHGTWWLMRAGAILMATRERERAR